MTPPKDFFDPMTQDEPERVKGMEAFRGILAEELRKTSVRDAEEVLRHVEAWRLTTALNAMRRAYDLGFSVSEKRAEEAEAGRATLSKSADNLARTYADELDQMHLRLVAVMSQRDSSQASLLRVVEALKPFAELADHPLCQGWKDWQPLWTAGRDEDNARIMFSDLRKARTALSPHTEK